MELNLLDIGKSRVSLYVPALLAAAVLAVIGVQSTSVEIGTAMGLATAKILLLVLLSTSRRLDDTGDGRGT
jgi:hypothetical protein